VANLDLRYQRDTYEQLRELACARGMAILVADHQLNLVAAYCDRVLVLHGGAVYRAGAPAEVITAELVREVFATEMRIERFGEGVPQCLWVR
jgi:iron complex transport system ATP-binding protein